MQRIESSLQLHRPSRSGRTHEVWAILRFPSYERVFSEQRLGTIDLTVHTGMILFHCTFLALQSQDIHSRMPLDGYAEIQEELCYSGLVPIDIESDVGTDQCLALSLMITTSMPYGFLKKEILAGYGWKRRRCQGI